MFLYSALVGFVFLLNIQLVISVRTELHVRCVGVIVRLVWCRWAVIRSGFICIDGDLVLSIPWSALARPYNTLAFVTLPVFVNSTQVVADVVRVLCAARWCCF